MLSDGANGAVQRLDTKRKELAAADVEECHTRDSETQEPSPRLLPCCCRPRACWCSIWAITCCCAGAERATPSPPAPPPPPAGPELAPLPAPMSLRKRSRSAALLNCAASQRLVPNAEAASTALALAPCHRSFARFGCERLRSLQSHRAASLSPAADCCCCCCCCIFACKRRVT